MQRNTEHFVLQVVVQSDKRTYLSFVHFSWHNTTVHIEDGVEGGPIAIYDRHGNVVIISPFSQFMAASNWHDGVIGGSVYWGIMGSIDQVPAGFSMETIVYFGNDGINKVSNKTKYIIILFVCVYNEIGKEVDVSPHIC